MKPKKLLALLLSVVLMVSMIPMNAMAAVSEGQNILKIDLMVSSSFNGSKDVKAGSTYNGLAPEQVASVDGMPAALKKWDTDAFTPEEEVQVSSGEVVYLAVKMGIDNPGTADNGKTYKGIAGAPNVVIKYDATKVTPSTLGNVAINKAATSSIFDAEIYENAYGYYGEPDQDALALLTGNYRSGLSAPGKLTKLSDGAGSYIALDYGLDSISYLTQKTTWDYVIPFTVNEGAESSPITGPIAFEVVKTGGGSHTSASFFADDLGFDEENGTAIDITTTGTTQYAISPTNNQAHYLLNDDDLSVTAAIKSDDPTVLTAADYPITDKKNLPYVDSTYAGKESIDEGPNDYIKLPANSGFEVGDSIVVYADADGNTKLGETIIESGTIYNETLGNWNSISTLDNDGSDIIRLVPKTGTEIQSGYGYIHGESQLWIARRQSGEFTAPSATLVGPIEPDTTIQNYDKAPHSYTEDVDAVEDGKPGSATNPIQVTLGDTVDSVLTKIANEGITLPTTVDAPYQNNQGKTETTTVNWNKWKDHMQPNAKTSSGNMVYSLHTAAGGSTVVRVPFPNTTNAVQPTAYYNGVIPTYGSVIHVKVLPNAGDYVVADNTSTETLKLSGKAKEYLKAGDVVKIYDAATEGNELAAVTVESGKDTYALDGDVLTKDAKVYLTTTHTTEGITTDRFEVTVTDGTLQVVKDEVIEGPYQASNGEKIFSAGPGITVKQIMAMAAPLQFYVQTVTDPVTVDLAAINYADNVAITQKQKTESGSVVDCDDVIADETTFNNQAKNNNDLFEITYTIPDGTLNDTDHTAYKGAGHTITLKVIIVTQVEITGGDTDDQDKNLTVKVTQNAPDGTRATGSSDNWDIIQVSGVKYVDTANHSYTADEKVKVNDTVNVYTKGATNPITTGTVKADDGDDTNGHTYTIWVNQLGRKPDPSQLEFTVSHENALNSRRVPFTTTETIPTEPYTLNTTSEGQAALTASWADPITVYAPEGDATITDISKFFEADEIPTSVDLEYYYLTDGAVDESTKAAKKVDLTAAGWSKPTDLTDTDLNSKTGYASTYTLEGLDSLTADDGVSISSDVSSITLNAKFRRIGTRFTGVPAGAATNKPYPENDTISIENPTTAAPAGDVTTKVFVYATQEDAQQQKNVLATVDLTGTGTAIDNVELGNNNLSSKAGKLYLTMNDTTGDYAPSTPVEVSYKTEPYILWDVKLSSTNKEIKREDLTGADEAAKLTDLKDNYLPTVMTAEVVHLTEGTGAASYVPKTGTEETMTYQLPVTWQKAGTPATELTATDLDLNGTGEVYLDLITRIEEADLTGKTVTLDSGETVPVNYNTPDTVDCRLSTFDQANFALTISSQEAGDPVQTELPANPENYVTYDRGNDNDPTNDTVTIKFADGETPTTPNMAGAAVNMTYPSKDGEKTVTGTLSSSAPATLIFNKDNGFEGLTLSEGTITLTFTDPDTTQYKESKNVKVPVEAYSGDYVLQSVKLNANAEDPTASRDLPTLHLMNDTTMAEIRELITFTSVTGVANDTDSTEIPSIPLKKTAGSTPVVDWQLYVDGTVESDVDNTIKAGDITKEYELRAELNLEGFTTSDGKQVKQPEEANKKVVAIIPIELYNNVDSYPVQLTDGNNDLWNSLKTGSTASNSDKAIAKKELEARGLTEADFTKFRTDAVFYYFSDSHDGFADEQADAQHVSDYVTNANIQSIKLAGEADPMSGEALTNWLTANSENVKITETTTARNKIAIPKYDASGNEEATGYEVIEPHNTDLKNKYVVYGGAITRTEENYLIRYQVTAGSEIFVATRKVKLTYKVGDYDLDMLITTNDRISMNTAISGKMMFVDPSADEERAAELLALSNRVGDFDLDTLTTTNDRIELNKVIAGGKAPATRW